MNDISEYRRLKFFEALRFVLALAVCLGAIALLAFCHGCAAPGDLPDGAYDFVPVTIFWLAACLVSFILPVVGWKTLRK